MCVDLAAAGLIQLRHLFELIFEGRDFVFEGGGESLEAFALGGLVVTHAVRVLLHAVVLVLENVDLLAEFVDGLPHGLDLGVLAFALLLKVCERGFKLGVQIIRVGLELGDVEAQVFGF
jgi:hypothetical protein